MTNDLYHHGRLGQKWGVKNGPPYPLSVATVKREYSRKRRSPFSYLKKVREKRELEEKARIQQKREEEEASRAADKERAIREGSATDLLPYLDELTTKEMQEASNRIKWTQTIQEQALSERSKEWNRLNHTMKKIGDVKDWAKTGAELLKAIDDSVKVLTGKGDQVSKGGGGKKKKNKS